MVQGSELTALINHKGDFYKTTTLAELEKTVSEIKEKSKQVWFCVFICGSINKLNNTIMKGTFFALFCCIFILSSCMTICTKPRQTITFIGDNGIKIYDATSNVKLGEIKDGNSTSITIEKQTGDKIIIAKKEGFSNAPIIVESNLNTKSLWNILFWPGFLIDLGTGQINKYDPVIYYIEMEKTSEK